MQDPNTLSRGQLQTLLDDAKAHKWLHLVDSYSNYLEQAPEYSRVWLQGVGYVPAKHGRDLKAGDVLLYNHGYTSTVLDVREKSPNFIEAELRIQDGSTYWRRIGKARLVACTAASL